MDQVYQCDKIKVNIIPSVIYLKLYIIMVVIYWNITKGILQSFEI